MLPSTVVVVLRKTIFCTHEQQMLAEVGHSLCILWVARVAYPDRDFCCTLGGCGIADRQHPEAMIQLEQAVSPVVLTDCPMTGMKVAHASEAEAFS